MCNVCMVTPCADGCPNAPDMPIVGACESCDEAIVPGDVCLYESDKYICPVCLTNMSARDLLEAIGLDMQIAEAVQ